MLWYLKRVEADTNASRSGAGGKVARFHPSVDTQKTGLRRTPKNRTSLRSALRLDCSPWERMMRRETPWAKPDEGRGAAGAQHGVQAGERCSGS